MRSQSPSERQPRGVTLVVAGLLALVLVVTAAGLLARTSSGGTTATARPVWTWSPPMPHRRSYTASTEIGDKIYVADTNNHRIQVVDLKTKQTQTLPLVGVEPPAATAKRK